MSGFCYNKIVFPFGKMYWARSPLGKRSFRQGVFRQGVIRQGERVLIDSLREDLLIRFKDLTELAIPNLWNPFGTNIETLDPQFQEEFFYLQNDIECNAIFNQCGYSAFWMKKEVSERYPHLYQTVNWCLLHFHHHILSRRDSAQQLICSQNKEIDWKYQQEATWDSSWRR